MCVFVERFVAKHGLLSDSQMHKKEKWNAENKLQHKGALKFTRMLYDAFD